MGRRRDRESQGRRPDLRRKSVRRKEGWWKEWRLGESGKGRKESQ